MTMSSNRMPAEEEAAELNDMLTESTARERVLDAEVDRLRAGLLACATAAGEDVSDGIPTWPDVVEWAVRAVREGRETYEQDNRDLTEGITRVAEWFERDRREPDKVLCHVQSLRRLNISGRLLPDTSIDRSDDDE